MYARRSEVKLCKVFEKCILLQELFIPSVRVIQARQPRDSGQAYGSSTCHLHLYGLSEIGLQFGIETISAGKRAR